MKEQKNIEFYSDMLKNTNFSMPDDISLPYSEDFSLLNAKNNVGKKQVQNRICYQPMEGQDAENDGSPSRLTLERYKTLAEGGAGIIWLEAVSVLPEARSNPHQLMITKKNLSLYKKLISDSKEACLKRNGFEPIIIVQLNHSGRHCKPDGKPAPLIAYHNPSFEKTPISDDRILSDDYLKTLPDIFTACALLSEEAGFDGVDIKCCHGYLFSELLSAYDRSGFFGGSFENRTRLLLDTASSCNASLKSETLKASRLNIFDGYIGKYSFSTDKENHEKYDLHEADLLISKLKENVLDIINMTMGSPYVNPDVSRPYRAGIDKPKTNPLAGESRLFSGVAEMHNKHKDLPCVNTGVSGLGAKSPYAAAGMIADNMTDFVGFGRMSFAYPDLARDILNGTFDEKKACVACSGCSILKKNCLKSGCIIRNRLYKDIYREAFVK